MKNILMKIMPRMIISCKHAARLVSDQMSHPLPWHKRIALQIHHKLCQTCFQYGRQIKSLHELLSQYEDQSNLPQICTDKQLSDEIKNEMKQNLRKII